MCIMMEERRMTLLLALSFEQGTGIREGKLGTGTRKGELGTRLKEGKQGTINSPALVAESAGTVVVDG